MLLNFKTLEIKSTPTQLQLSVFFFRANISQAGNDNSRHDLHFQVRVAHEESRYNTYKLMWTIRITKIGIEEADIDKHRELIRAEDFDFFMMAVAGQAKACIEHFQEFHIQIIFYPEIESWDNVKLQNQRLTKAKIPINRMSGACKEYYSDCLFTNLFLFVIFFPFRFRLKLSCSLLCWWLCPNSNLSSTKKYTFDSMKRLYVQSVLS